MKKGTTKITKNHTVKPETEAMKLLVKQFYRKADKGLNEVPLTRKSVAKDAGVTLALVCYVLNGERSTSWDTYQRLANAVGLDLEANNIKKEDHFVSRKKAKAVVAEAPIWLPDAVMVEAA